MDAGDVNGDGKPDFALGNAGTSGVGVTVFLANPDGTLQTGVNYGTSGGLDYVATGDFDGDGKLDMVASDASSGSVSLFSGNGDGTFNAAQTFSAISGAAGRMVVGDFNQDGKLDIAVTGWQPSVAVLLNNGLGGFQTPASYALTAGGLEMGAGDVNGDGNLDLVIPDQSGSTASLLLGNSDGTFQAPLAVDLGFSNPAEIAIGDFNHDGHKDLAVAIDDANGMGVAIALGNGDGTFQPATLNSSTAQNLDAFPGGVQIVDLDQDGNLDVVCGNSGVGTVGILFGKGDGTFYSPVEFPAGGYPDSLVMADMNADGAGDAISVDHTSPGLVVLLNAAGNTISLTSSLNPAPAGQNVTLTAVVSATVRGVRTTPTGSVNFMEGATVLGTSALSGGQASVTLSTLSPGSHVITANYSGDLSFVPSVSAAIAQVITPGGGATPDYSLSASPSSATIQPGQSASFTITVTPTSGYNGTGDFSCGALPVGVSCQFVPSSVSLSGAPAQAVLQVSAAATVASTSLAATGP